MSEWKTYRLEDLCTSKGSYGIGAPAVAYDVNKYTYLRITDINDDGTLNHNGLMSVDDERAGDYLLKENDIVFARTGNSTGRTYFYDGRDGELVYAGFLIKFSLDNKKVNPRILKYYTHSQPYYDWVRSFDTGGTRGNINAKVFGAMPITLPPRYQQDRIVEILKSFDDKIELNRRINANLEAQAQALFRSWFVDFEPFRDGPFVDSELGKIPQGWKVGAASEFYKNITIGKTPPRKEHQWFSKESHDIVWVSIADMGNCGLSICNSSEYLTPEAIKKFNICIVPVNTVLLSFKLTIGRVAIADKELATNEAIAHFQTQHNTLEYTNLALKNYEFSSLGSTSSIATAVNSKIIKSMPWMMPSDDVLNQFHNVLSPIFNGIRNNIQEITRLSALRDTLLPKLMAGEF